VIQRPGQAVLAIALAGGISTVALAEGAGKYTISGTHIKDKSEYQGTATLTQTGHMTWEVVEDIGGDTFEGFGVGDGKTIAVTFATDGSTVVALYLANPDGSYTGIWADEGDKEVSRETLKPQ
jgi:hypothetical protein